jgi:hypothetical protein
MERFEERYVRPEPKPQSFLDYVGGAGRSALTGAIVYGLSTAFPPVGAFAIPAYTALTYSKMGYGLYKVYEERLATGRASPKSVSGASSSVGEAAANQPSDAIAAQVATAAYEHGVFNDLASHTGLESVVLKEMVKGSTSSALSTVGGDLLKFAIGKAVGG